MRSVCARCRSVNVCGRKLWRLLPPEHTPLLLDRFGRETAPCFSSAGCHSEAAERFPNLAAAAPHVLTCVQVRLRTISKLFLACFASASAFCAVRTVSFWVRQSLASPPLNGPAPLRPLSVFPTWP